MTGQLRLSIVITCLLTFPTLLVIAAPATSHDPGPRGGPAGAGGPLANLTAGQLAAFTDGADDSTPRIPWTAASLAPTRRGSVRH